MIKNMRNWRIMMAIAVTAGITLMWQNCSQQVGFGTMPTGLNSKAGSVVVPALTETGDSAQGDVPAAPPIQVGTDPAPAPGSSTATI